ncbi:MAG TPA: hypothetical protein DDZ88_30215 [Verrucomicrobiales bacterium]|nr:hypothetical protein [Verrucomicrobiales bacterium]
MAKPQDIIKAMTSSLHQAHLKALGFNKSDMTWIRPLEWPQVINIQLSSSNSATQARFTINLGVSIPCLGTALKSSPLEGALKEYDCELRSRIGHLFPNKHDKWWDVTSISDADQLVGEVFADISRYILPWFERLKTLPEVATELANKKSFLMAAIAFHLAGDSCAAASSMAEAYAQANQLALPKLRRLAKAHSIPITG